MKRNADGSFTIYVQHDNPRPDKKSNPLPAPGIRACHVSSRY
ncbi:MAG: DUF1214 domain-containing protein [Beijerinckiaceae bacterium]